MFVQEPVFSLLEGVLSRSDSKVADLVFLAWKEGAIFDTSEQYGQHFLWQSAWEKLAWIPWST